MHAELGPFACAHFIDLQHLILPDDVASDILSYTQYEPDSSLLTGARTSAALLMLALRLLNALAGTAACAWGAAAHGGTLFLLSLLLPAYQGGSISELCFQILQLGMCCTCCPPAASAAIWQALTAPPSPHMLPNCSA